MGLAIVRYAENLSCVFAEIHCLCCYVPTFVPETYYCLQCMNVLCLAGSCIYHNFITCLSAIDNAANAEIQLMASTPQSSHIVWLHYDNAFRILVTLMCTCVDEQLNTLISREGVGTTIVFLSSCPCLNMWPFQLVVFMHICNSLFFIAVVEPASNLRVLEVASKSMRLTWDASIGDISGYKVQLIPRTADSKLQDLYVGPTQTTVMVRDLAADTEYQISLFALRRLTPSEPVTAMQKTEPVQVSLGEFPHRLIFHGILNNFRRIMFLPPRMFPGCGCEG